eukprot:1394921-Amorphochlora_amoeboformis.AAC.1
MSQGYGSWKGGRGTNLGLGLENPLARNFELLKRLFKLKRTSNTQKGCNLERVCAYRLSERTHR